MDIFGAISAEQFMQQYWQKKPLLIKQAFPDWQNIVSPEELAGLSLEHFIESRLLIGNSRFDQWQLEHGPFKEERFSTLGKQHWTLLVQGVDQWVEDVSILLDQFRFTPNWRVDDVMISYAVDEGSVGPHFDNYDVFLIQGLGKREWQVGLQCDASTPLADHHDLKIIKHMDVVDKWILEPGDMLYIPPKFSHWGRAIGESMTYSIGYTSPSESQIINHICDDYVSRCDDNKRYTDPELSIPDSPGEITAEALAKIKAMLSSLLNDEEQIIRAFGELVTEPKNPENFQSTDLLAPEQISQLINDNKVISVNSSSNFSYFVQPNKCILFVDGQSFICTSQGSIAVAQQLANAGGLMIDDMSVELSDNQTLILLSELMANDSIEFISD
jgi:50S ribosomal protein L16 3-hydroxylase